MHICICIHVKRERETEITPGCMRVYTCVRIRTNRIHKYIYIYREKGREKDRFMCIYIEREGERESERE